MRVLRIQDIETGRGLYAKCVFHANLDLNDPSCHPAPRHDSGLGPEAMNFLYDRQDIARFGFSSEDQLRRWLYHDEWLVRLHEVGAELVVYEADTAYAGHTQVIFDISTAAVVSRHPLTSLL